MAEKIERTNIVCNKNSRIRIADYTSENDFDKKYKILLINDSQEIIYASNISQIETNFEVSWKDYASEISSLKEKCRAYEEIIGNFLNKLDVRINDPNIHTKHIGHVEVKDYNNDIQKR